MPRGLLHVEMDCPTEMEEEFHAWYNTDHLPERVSLPGFVRARRHTALEGAPRWLASYELDSLAALESPEYLRCMGPNQTAWTKRIVSHVSVYRGVYELAWGEVPPAGSPADLDARGLLAVRYDGGQEHLSRINAWHDAEYAPQLLQLPGVLTARRYSGVAPRPDCLALYELSDPWVVQNPQFARVWTEGWGTRRRELPAFKRILYIRILPGS